METEQSLITAGALLFILFNVLNIVYKTTVVII